MGPRIYPSYQDTNLTSKGSLILSIDSNIDYIDIYINNILVNKEYSTINGLYSFNLNINDIFRIESNTNFSLYLNRNDYTTDDNNSNNGIINTLISNINNNSTYTFTASTIFNSYNFEYLGTIGFAGPTFTPTPTPIPTPLPFVERIFNGDHPPTLLSYSNNLIGNTWVSGTTTPMSYLDGSSNGLIYVIKNLDDGYLYSTTEGSIWTIYNNKPDSNSAGLVFFDSNNTQWLVSSITKLYKTNDFITYTLILDAASTISQVFFDGYTYFVCSEYFINRSTDLVNWTTINNSNGISLHNRMAYNGTIYVNTGALTSTDGINWTGNTNINGPTFLGGGLLNDIIWDGTKFIAVGFGGSDLTNAKVAISSTDGITWSTFTPLNSFFKDVGYNGRIVSIFYNGTSIVARGWNFNNGTREGIAYSTNLGSTWTMSNLLGPTYFEGSIWGNPTFEVPLPPGPPPTATPTPTPLPPTATPTPLPPTATPTITPTPTPAPVSFFWIYNWNNAQTCNKNFVLDYSLDGGSTYINYASFSGTTATGYTGSTISLMGSTPYDFRTRITYCKESGCGSLIRDSRVASLWNQTDNVQILTSSSTTDTTITTCPTTVSQFANLGAATLTNGKTYYILYTDVFKT